MLSGLVRGYEDGDVIFSQGDAAADMYVVRSGAVRVFRSRDGADLTLATLGAGEFFGEMALFAPGTRNATAVAVGPTECEVLDKPAFLALIKDPVVWDMLAKMSARMREADETIEGLSDTEERR